MTTVINYWAVLAAAVSSIVVGGIWYGPLFGKAYIKAMGWESYDKAKTDEMKKGMGASYFYQFLASIVTAWVLAVFINKIGITGSMSAVKVAMGAWLGFVLPLKFGESLWGGKKTLFYLGAGSSLVTLIVMGLILGVMR